MPPSAPGPGGTPPRRASAPTARLRARWHGLLRRVVREALEPRRALLPPARAELDALRAGVDALGLAVGEASREVQGVRDDLALFGLPYSAEMTVDQAWRRHPGAPAVFARHHLPACDGCAVRFDETLEEAAMAYGLDLPRLLAELAALLPRSASEVG